MDKDALIRRAQLQKWLLIAWGMSISLAVALCIWRYAQIVWDPAVGATGTGIDTTLHDWQVKLAKNLAENVLSGYLPIIAVMLSSFFSASESYRHQQIRLTQAVAAAGIFGLLQLLSLLMAIVFLFFSSSLLEGTIPGVLSGSLATIMGLIVTFSFPEQAKRESSPTDTRPA